MSALEKYKALRKDAAELRKWAGPDCAAGPSFWRSLLEHTVAALARKDAGPGPLSKAQVEAIASCRDFQSIWREAARDLDARADRMVRELDQQAAEIAALKAALEGK